jgi:hypothetical protein
MKTNVFLPITPYTLSLCENLIKAKYNSSAYHNVLVNAHGLSFNKKIWNETFEANSSRKVFSNKWKTTLVRIKQIYIFKHLYKELRVYRNKPISFFYVDLAHLLTNAVFFGFKKINQRFVVEDGLLNYYKVTLKNKTLNSPINNKVFNCLGLPTKPFSGHITGIEMNPVNAQYVFFPELAYANSKSKQIPFEKINYNPEKAILILGQEPIVNFISKKDYLEILFNFISYQNKEKNYIVYYKPHHHGESDYVISFLKHKLGKDLRIVAESTPIHLIISKMKPMKVFSFGSTASLVLKKTLPASVVNEVCMINAKGLINNKKIEKVFLKSGINTNQILIR